MNAWIYLAMAILLEVSGTACMKLSYGFTRLLPSALMMVFYLLSFSSLTMALRQIPLSTAYAVWSGVGTALIAIIGFVCFREAATLVKVASIGLIVAGVVGLKLAK
jgi:small multidrug resistance pump